MLTYEDGYRNGHCDRLLGIDPLIISLTWPNRAFADGYRAGYYARKEQKDEDDAERK